MTAPRKPMPSMEHDPLAGAFPVRWNLPAFLFSTAFHAAVLLALTTIVLVLGQT